MKPDGASGLLTDHEAQARRTHEGPSSHAGVLGVGERKRPPRLEKKFVLGSRVCPCNDKLPPEKCRHIGERDPRSEIMLQDESNLLLWRIYRGCIDHYQLLRDKWIVKPRQERAGAMYKAEADRPDNILNIQIGVAKSRTHGKARRMIPRD